MVTGVLLLVFLYNTVNLRLWKTRKLHCHKHSRFRFAQGLQARCSIKYYCINPFEEVSHFTSCSLFYYSEPKWHYVAQRITVCFSTQKNWEKAECC